MGPSRDEVDGQASDAPAPTGAHTSCDPSASQSPPHKLRSAGRKNLGYFAVSIGEVDKRVPHVCGVKQKNTQHTAHGHCQRAQHSGAHMAEHPLPNASGHFQAH
eukprot:6491162-Amphidinium_carterae.1